MKHLFIINPAAGKVKGRAHIIEKQVRDFFALHSGIAYDIYTTEWCRDAVGFVRRYIMNMIKNGGYEPLRVHAMGGPGTFYEVVNAVAGTANVSVASYPLGDNYHFLRYFSPEKSGVFSSIEKQVFSGAIPIDIIRCGHNIGVNASYIGLEARADMLGDEMIEKGWPSDFSYTVSALRAILGSERFTQHYSLEMDGQRMDGEYVSITIANGPCYGRNFCPAPHAHPDDGLLDFYLIRKMPKWKVMTHIKNYLSGRDDRLPRDLFSHYRGRRLRVSSEHSVSMCIDGENFIGSSFEYEIVPHGINFVCPDEIDLSKLPLVFSRPKEGMRG